MGFHWSLGAVSLLRPWATEQGTAGPNSMCSCQDLDLFSLFPAKSQPQKVNFTATKGEFWLLKTLMSLDGVLFLKEYRILNDTLLNKLWKSGYLWKERIFLLQDHNLTGLYFPPNLVFQVKMDTERQFSGNFTKLCRCWVTDSQILVWYQGQCSSYLQFPRKGSKTWENTPKGQKLNK